MTRELSRRSLLASGGALFAGSAVAAAGAVAAVDESAADPPSLRWSETYDGAATDNVQDALRTDDGNYVVVGQSGEDAESVRPWAFSIDERGARRWQRRIDGDDVAGFNAVLETGDGGFLLGGYRGRPRNGQEPLFLKLNADREVQWRRTVESPRQGAVVASLAPAGDQYVAVALARGETALDISGWIFGIDGEAERQWSQTYGPRHTNYVTSLAETGDGNYVLGGGTRAESTEDNQQPPFVGWLFEVDDEGSQQWSTTYREATDGTDHQLNFFYDVYATDSGYLAAGGTSPDLLEGQRGWVLSVDGSGERREQLQTRPTDMEVAQFQRIRPFEDGYALVGVAQTSSTDPANVWAAGVDGDLARQWSATQQFANGSQAVTALGTGDGGLAVFGNANVEGGQSATDALAVKLGGDPTPTATPGATTEAEEATATPSPTPSPTPAPTPSPSPTATPSTAATEPDTDATTGGGPETTADDGPGFGIGTALAALGGGALLRESGLNSGVDADED